jgi:hypothetical protein
MHGGRAGCSRTRNAECRVAKSRRACLPSRSINSIGSSSFHGTPSFLGSNRQDLAGERAGV